MKGIYITALLLIIIGCSPAKEKVTFSVANNSSTTIFVQYIDSGDTTNSTILSSSGHLISEFFLTEGKSTNWYNDYSVHFNSITNIFGDTVTFNPNEASNWSLYSQSSINYYTLFIGDSSF